VCIAVYIKLGVNSYPSEAIHIYLFPYFKIGNPAMKWNLEAVDVAKRYHGYVFSWAVIYTFWYHPMEGMKYIYIIMVYYIL
jgi:hypothetical protein